MAKKQEGDASAEAAAETKKPKGAKPEKGDKPEQVEGKKPAKPKAPKEDKGSPAAPAGEGAPAAPTAEGEKASRKASPAEPGKKKRKPGVPPSRGKKLKNHLKNLRQRIIKEGPQPLEKAVALLKQMKRSKFDETVEIHVWLGVDVTQSDQLVRGTVPLPHGVGKSVRVAVFCQGDNVQKAKDAGADAAGGDDLIEKVQKQNWLEFDVALATQDMMGKVSRLGKVLGPRGLMPTPKAGTVITSDVGQAVKEFKAGKVEYRTDKGGSVHAGVGKLSFEEKKLIENITAFMDAVKASKPSGLKGHYIRTVTICSTMSPGVPVAVTA